MAPLELAQEGHIVPSTDYSDASGMDNDDNEKSIAKGGVTTPFPWKLHDMLDDMARDGNHSVVTWQPHGRAFMVHKPKDFVVDIMPHYFNQTKYASFQRQLNLYGFSRLSHGKDKGAYYHMCFVRGDRNLCRNMIRQKIKGTKVRRSLSPEEEPNFYLPHWNKCKPTSPAASKQSADIKEPAHTMFPTLQHPASPPAPHKVAKHNPIPLAPPNSLLSMMKEKPKQSAPTLIPPLPGIKVFQLTSEPAPMPVSPSTQRNAKAGDLLFFEGRPFRYLEHLEELPPVLAPALPMQGPPRQLGSQRLYKESLHDMINSIVSMESSWKDRSTHRNICSV